VPTRMFGDPESPQPKTEVHVKATISAPAP
jgi:hypothetical protein